MHDDHVTALYWAIYYLQSTFYYGNYEEIEILTEQEQLRLTDDMRAKYVDAIDYIKSPEAMQEQHKLGAMVEASN